VGHFIRHETVRIELGTHPMAHEPEWWEVKAQLSVSDRAAVLDAMHSYKFAGNDEQDDHAYIMRGLGKLREMVTIGWQLFDDDGKRIPFDRGMIADLDPDSPTTEKIDSEIARLHPFQGKKPVSASTAG
jgi:hypothetical protein